MVKPAHGLPSFISQLRGAPSGKDAPRRDHGSLQCRTSGNQTLHKPFESSSSSSRIVMTDNGLSTNKQTNKPTVCLFKKKQIKHILVHFLLLNGKQFVVLSGAWTSGTCSSTRYPAPGWRGCCSARPGRGPGGGRKVSRNCAIRGFPTKRELLPPCWLKFAVVLTSWVLLLSVASFFPICL